MPEERILPPFPDVIVTGGSRQDAIQFLMDLRLPSRIARAHLVRWGEVAGVVVTPSDLRQVGFRGDGVL